MYLQKLRREMWCHPLPDDLHQFFVVEKDPIAISEMLRDFIEGFGVDMGFGPGFAIGGAGEVRCTFFRSEDVFEYSGIKTIVTGREGRRREVDRAGDYGFRRHGVCVRGMEVGSDRNIGRLYIRDS